MAAKCTVWDVLTAAAKYDGSPTAHQDVISTLNKHGHNAKMTDEWCTETNMAILYDAGGIDLVGGYAQISGTLKKNAEKLGIWKTGTGDILPGDLIVFAAKDGTPNHTELALGANVDLCGNYKQISRDTCRRRTRSGRSILGRVRPKYAPMDPMDDLQVTLAAAECMLGVYGSGTVREKQLSVFGEKNVALIQQEINRVWGKMELESRDMAVYIIAGRAGKEDYRTERMGPFANEAQAAINALAGRAGKSLADAAEDVLADIYGKGAVRRLLLRFNGYDAGKVQAMVDELVRNRQDQKKQETPPQKEPASGDGHPRIRVWGVWFFEGDETQFGDATAIIQYGADDKTIEHVVLIDTAKKTGKTVKKLRAAGIRTIDAVVISHAHGDHYGALTDVFNSFKVKALYLPDTSGLDHYQKTYASAIRSQERKAKKYGASCTYLKAGKGFTVGKIRCDCVWQAPASALPEHDEHHFVNNQSIVTRFTLDGKVIFHSAGDLQNEANNLLIKAVGGLRADIFKCQWHGDANACNPAICKAVMPKIAFSNYHHFERSGRGATRKRLEEVGAVVARNAENGDIYIDCKNGEMDLTCSKGNLHKKLRSFRA